MPNCKPRRNLTVEERLGYLDAEFQQSELLGVILNALKDRSPRVRSRAVQLAIDSVIREARPHITEALTDRSEQVRMDAAECIGVFDKGLGEANRELQCLLEDQSSLVRIEAIESLNYIRDKSSLRRIIRLLGDRDPLVRSYAATAVASLGGPEQKPILNRRLKVETNDSAKVGILASLVELGDRHNLSQFLGLLDSHDYRVRCAISNFLGRMKLSVIEQKQAVESLKKARSRPIAFADKTSVESALKNLENADRADD